MRNSFVAPSKEHRIALVTCIQNEERFLKRFLDYHRAVGVGVAYLFLDRCTDRSRAIASRYPWVHLIELPAWVREKSAQISEMHCQCMNTALAWCREEGWDWLLTLDPDEFLIANPALLATGNALEAIRLGPLLDSVEPEVEQIRFPTWEVIPGACEHWWELDRFQTVACASFQLPDGGERWRGFLGHAQGKALIRTSARLQAYDSHRWVDDQRHLGVEQPEYTQIPTLWTGCHLHYCATNGVHFFEKYAKAAFEPPIWSCGSPVERPRQIFKELSATWDAARFEQFLAEELRPAWSEADEREGRIAQVTLLKEMESLAALSDANDSPYANERPFPSSTDSSRNAGWRRLAPDTWVAEIGNLHPRDLRHWHGLERGASLLFRWSKPHFGLRLPVAASAVARIEFSAGPLDSLVAGRVVRAAEPPEDPPPGQWGWFAVEPFHSPNDARALGVPVVSVQLTTHPPTNPTGSISQEMAFADSASSSTAAECSLVTVILPVRNEAIRIVDHLRHMAAWRGKAGEMLVVEGASTDDSVELLHAHWPGDPPRWIHLERGLYRAWNHGVREARFPFVYFSTVGDHLDPDGLQKLVAVQQAFDADIVLSPPRLVDCDGNPANHQWPIHWLIEETGADQARLLTPTEIFCLSFGFHLEGLLGSSASNLYRRELLLNAPFDESTGHPADTLWAMEHAHKCRIALLPESVAQFVWSGAPTHLRQEELCAMEADFLKRAIAARMQSPDAAVRDATIWIRLLAMQHVSREDYAQAVALIQEQHAYIALLEKTSDRQEHQRLQSIIAEQTTYIQQLKHRIQMLETPAPPPTSLPTPESSPPLSRWKRWFART